MSREPALEVGECPLTRHSPQVRRVTHTHLEEWTGARALQPDREDPIRCIEAFVRLAHHNTDFKLHERIRPQPRTTPMSDLRDVSVSR
eukprot:5930778-Prymnesium_polylepis.1